MLSHLLIRHFGKDGTALHRLQQFAGSNESD